MMTVWVSWSGSGIEYEKLWHGVCGHAMFFNFWFRFGSSPMTQHFNNIELITGLGSTQNRN